jgi:UDP-2-acetamido-2,6-beta-L-arabino-hexul-4-ose reductase
MKVLVTGAEGFIGKNLVVKLGELPGFDAIKAVRSDSEDVLRAKLVNADALIHLAGENRPKDSKDFNSGNVKLTDTLCNLMVELDVKIPVLFSSSTQVNLNNAYGKSKRSAEIRIENYSKARGISTVIYRLPGVFGKWCKPNYNSVVATFCNNIATGVPVRIDDPTCILDLVYIDDVIDSFIGWLKGPSSDGTEFKTIDQVYNITLGELAKQIQEFAKSRKSLVSERVGTGFIRALYSTYVSYIPRNKFEYPIPSYGDERGVFVEMLKTKDSGQFSFFTAPPGITRGGHYHHTKTEKFLVIKGNARFRFRHILTDELFSVDTSGKTPTIVETIPGWSHDITNIGEDEMVVMLWANEIFDRENPDTYAKPVIGL